MVARVQFLEALASHVRIDLRGRQIAVAEQHLHHAQVRAVIEQMGGKGMSQSMGREVPVDAGLAGITLDDVPERLARHAISAARREEKIGAAVEQNVSAPAVYEGLEPSHGFLAERNQALAIALAEHANDALIEIDLRELQVHEFGYPQTGGIEHFEHGAIAVSERIGHGWGCQQCLDFRFAE